jgi:hypothetical protein
MTKTFTAVGLYRFAKLALPVFNVSEFLSRRRREEYRSFLGLLNFPRKWNNGMVERWSAAGGSKGC